MVYRAAASLLICAVTLLSLAGLDPFHSGSPNGQLGPSVARAGSVEGSDNDNLDDTADNLDRLFDNDQFLDNLDITIIVGGSGGTGGSTGGTGGSDNSQTDENGDNEDNFEFDNFDDEDDDGDVSIDVGWQELGTVPSTVAAARVVSVCARAGQETVLTSTDGSIAVRLLPTLPQDVSLTLRPELSLAPVPPTPGLRVGGIVFELAAEGCGGGSLAELPAQVNLSVRYTALDVSGLDEQRLVLARLDPSTNLWEPAPAQVLDPGTNYASATITRLGYYTLYYELF